MSPASNPADLDSIRAGAARARVPAPPGVAAIPRRARRAGGQFPAGDRDLRGLLRDRRDAARPMSSARSCPNSAAAQRGIQPGDRIVSVADRDTPTFDDVANVVLLRPNETRRRRDRARRAAAGTERSRSGRRHDRSDGPQNSRAALLGVIRRPRSASRCRCSRPCRWRCDQTARAHALDLSTAWSSSSRGQVSPKQLGGPIKIAQIAGQGAELGLLPFVGLLALLSINLGFINLLPVPMLDGGHLFFYAVEAVRRRPLSAQALDWAFRGGLAVILALAGLHDSQRFGLARPLGPASALDWLGGLGQGSNRGLAAERAAAPIRTKGGDA